MDNPPYTIYPLGDSALTIEMGTAINCQINEKVMQAFHQLQQNPIQHIIDIIPAYCSLTIVYDTYSIKKSNPAWTAFNWIKEQVIAAIKNSNITHSNKRLIQIPVCYDTIFGPDLELIAEHAGISVEEVILLHSERTYHVFMIGFLPGFPYMGTVNTSIQMPRKSKPRSLVAAGSVGIAGEQTGIYPLESPGGWQIIGQTALPLFDISLESPCLLQPGDEVQFNPIGLDEFYSIKQSGKL